MTFKMKRRTFIKTTILGLAGLTLGCQRDDGSEGEEFHALNLFVNIGTDDTIRVVVIKNELGQGITTALPMIVAEELEADWEQVTYEMRPEMGEYGGGVMANTAGSMSVRGNYATMREMGATAKEMLIAAAAARWGVDPGSLAAENSVITHPSMGNIKYSELATDAALLPVP
ncbi:MAG: molybdopterin-dependent oxidoreductase, partial [Proteobacteria bacterium]|nr:molybdopterin-dependent oxidoreductase [Pseudomonadota bacterium]